MATKRYNVVLDTDRQDKLIRTTTKIGPQGPPGPQGPAGIGGGPIDDLTNVTEAGKITGSVLIYNAISGFWEAGELNIDGGTF